MLYWIYFVARQNKTMFTFYRTQCVNILYNGLKLLIFCVIAFIYFITTQTEPCSYFMGYSLQFIAPQKAKRGSYFMEYIVHLPAWTQLQYSNRALVAIIGTAKLVPTHLIKSLQPIRRSGTRSSNELKCLD